MADTFRALGSEKYVVLTTKRKSGATVPTPVWIAPLADGSLGFTTDLDSGKVKRIRNFPDVTIQPSNARGVVKPGTAPVTVRATVLTGADADPVGAAIKQKYGLMVTLIGALYTVRRVVTRAKASPGAAIRFDPVG